MRLLTQIVLLAVMFVFSVMVQSEVTEKYYESGALQFEYQKKNGKLHGISKEYYETGELKAEIAYKRGKLVAKKTHLRNGDMEYELKYENGKKLETRNEYYVTGEPFRRRTYINGKREKLEIEYYRDGKTKAERNYVNGKKKGSARGYYINGKLMGDWLFENDEPISATLFYKTGEKWIVHSHFDSKGRIEGVSKEYDKAGKLMALRFYKQNDMVKRTRVGAWLQWWWELRY
jgi:antitoxin component YwqK of YwqJK toxin-antitoxin module